MNHLEYLQAKNSLANLKQSELVYVGNEHLHSLFESTVKELEEKLAEQDKLDSDRIGDWFPTYSGCRFWALDPRPEDISIVDIAHCLSLINRFNGHTQYRNGYSVAQHCVLCSLYVDQKYALEALLHDAAEAYVGDVVAPIKRLLGNKFSDIEDKILKVIYDTFGVVSTPESAAAVHAIDIQIVSTEIKELTLFGIANWKIVRPEPLDINIEPISADFAEYAFMERFKELYAARTQ